MHKPVKIPKGIPENKTVNNGATGIRLIKIDRTKKHNPTIKIPISYPFNSKNPATILNPNEISFPLGVPVRLSLTVGLAPGFASLGAEIQHAFGPSTSLTRSYKIECASRVRMQISPQPIEVASLVIAFYIFM